MITIPHVLYAIFHCLDDDTGSLDGGGGGGSGDLNLTLEDSSSNDVILSPPSSSIGVNSDAVTILPIAVDGVEVSSRQLPAPVSPMAPAGFDVTSQLTSSILSRVAPKRYCWKTFKNRYLHISFLILASIISLHISRHNFLEEG